MNVVVGHRTALKNTIAVMCVLLQSAVCEKDISGLQPVLSPASVCSSSKRCIIHKKRSQPYD